MKPDFSRYLSTLLVTLSLLVTFGCADPEADAGETAEETGEGP